MLRHTGLVCLFIALVFMGEALSTEPGFRVTGELERHYSTSEHPETWRFTAKYSNLEPSYYYTIDVFSGPVKGATKDYSIDAIMIETVPEGVEIGHSYDAYGNIVVPPFTGVQYIGIVFDATTQTSNLAESDQWTTTFYRSTESGTPIGAKLSRGSTTSVYPPVIRSLEVGQGQAVTGKAEFSTAEENGIPHSVIFLYKQLNLTGEYLMGHDLEREDGWGLVWDSRKAANGNGGYEAYALACDSVVTAMNYASMRTSHCFETDKISFVVENDEFDVYAPKIAGGQSKYEFGEDPGKAIDVSFTDDLDLDRAYYLVEDDESPSYTGTIFQGWQGKVYDGNWAVNWDALQEGNNKIYIKVYDDVGRLTSGKIYVKKVTETVQPPPPEEPEKQDTTAPPAPTGLGAVAGDEFVKLGWNASTDESGIANYRVYRNGSFLRGTGNTTYTDNGLSNGTTYYYAVSAVDGAGNESVKSGTVGATPGSGSVSENKAPVIESFSSNAGRINNGDSVSFDAYAYDPDGDELTYKWFFGDGETDEGIDLDEVEHNYKLPAGDVKKEYFVTLEVSDGENSAGKTLEITVEQPMFNINFVMPAEDTVFKKGEEIEILLEVRDIYGLPMADVESVEISFEGEALRSRKEAEGIYSASYESSFTDKKVSSVYAFVEAEIDGVLIENNALRLVHFRPGELKIAAPFDSGAREMYVGSKIGRVCTRASSLDAEFVENDAEVSAIFSCTGGKFRMPYAGEEEFCVEIDYVLGEGDIGCEVTISAEDRWGNEGSGVFMLPVSGHNPLFGISLLRPDLGKGKVFGFGQNVRFEVAVSGKEAEKIAAGTKITLNIPGLLEGREFSKDLSGGENYILDYRMPTRDSNRNELTLEIRGSASAGGEEFSASKVIEDVLLTGAIDVNVLYPRAGEATLDIVNPNRLVVELRYPNGEKLEAGEVDAYIKDNNSEQGIVFVRDGQTGLYTADLGYDLGIGKHVMAIELRGNFRGNEVSVVTEIMEPFDLMLIVYAVVVMFVVFGVSYFGYLRWREYAVERGSLETQRTGTLKLMRKLRFEYFKRHLTEQEYKKNILEYEQKLHSAERKLGYKPTRLKDITGKKVSELKPRKRALLGFFGKRLELMKKGRAEKKVVEKPKSAFSEIEEASARRLANILGKRKGEFSREEMRMAMKAEGYGDKVAKRALEKIFGK